MTFEEWASKAFADFGRNDFNLRPQATAKAFGRDAWDASEKAATAAEREACAVTVEKTLLPQNITDAIAALIRARSDD